MRPRTGLGSITPHEIGVYYSTADAKWAIYNLELSAMHVGASFDLWTGHSAAWPDTLSVTASAANTYAGYMVYLDDARFNNQPTLAPIVS
jgi:hypothetical protein